MTYSADDTYEILNKGLYEVEQGNYLKGKEYLENFLSKDEDIEAYLCLIEVEIKIKDFQNADRLALKAIKRYPEDTRPLYERVVIRKKMAENENTGWRRDEYTDEYYNLFESYLEKIDYADSDKIFQLGNSYFKDKFYEKSRDIFIMDKNLDERNLFGAATTNRFLGNYRKAASLYGKILQLNPEFYQGYLGRGASYQHLGDYNRAIKDFEIYLEYKKDINVYIALGNIYMYTERYNKAKELLENAQKNYPSSKVIRELLVEVYSKQER
jgi:tetratricopeptide (TPR) repeat protein